MEEEEGKAIPGNGGIGYNTKQYSFLKLCYCHSGLYLFVLESLNGYDAHGIVFMDKGETKEVKVSI